MKRRGFLSLLAGLPFVPKAWAEPAEVSVGEITMPSRPMHRFADYTGGPAWVETTPPKVTGVKIHGTNGWQSAQVRAWAVYGSDRVKVTEGIGNPPLDTWPLAPGHTLIMKTDFVPVVMYG